MTMNAFELPLVAILRGLAPTEAAQAGSILFEAGFRLLEVPLNRPGALACISTLSMMAPVGAIVGGGTMLNVADVEAVYAAGGRMLVAPNYNPSVIRHARELGMLCVPGVATPSEAFAALDAGADALKIFPAEMVGNAGMKAIKTVLPAQTQLLPVGGVTPESMAGWVQSGATGFGIGSQLYQPGGSFEELAQRAQSFVDAWRQLKENKR